MLVAYLVALAAAVGLWLVWFEPWYERVSLPAWSPSAAVLRLGWGAGLITTGGALWLIRDTEAALAGLATGLLWAQLGAALVWAVMFITRRQARTAFYVICLHWAAVALAAAAVSALAPAAGVMLLPWLGFITYLGAFNFFVWQLEQRP